MAKETPRDYGNCPYDVEYGEGCRVHCGLGVDEDKPTIVYTIKYRETYEGTYDIVADSLEEAKEKLANMISEGKEAGPDQCVSSEYEFVDSDCY